MTGFDGSIYPERLENVPRRLAIPRLNRLIVEQSGFAIAYVTHTWGGAAKTLEFAMRREKKGLLHLENLGGEWLELHQDAPP